MNEPDMPSNPLEGEVEKGVVRKKSAEKGVPGNKGSEIGAEKGVPGNKGSEIGAEKGTKTVTKDDTKTVTTDNTDTKVSTKKRIRRTNEVNDESADKGTDNYLKQVAKKEGKEVGKKGNKEKGKQGGKNSSSSKNVFGSLKKKKEAGKVPENSDGSNIFDLSENSGDSEGPGDSLVSVSKPAGIKKYLQTFKDLSYKLSGKRKDKGNGQEISGKSPENEKKPTFADTYKAFCFRFGLHFDKSPQNDLAKSLYQADLEMTPGMFISLSVVTSLLASVLVFFISCLVFWSSESPLVYIFPLTFLTFVLCLGGFPFTLYNKVSNKDMNIEHEIPFALSYMSILASGGSSPIEVIRRVSEEDYGDVSKEFSKVMFRIDVLGEDGNSAMSHLIRNTSSELLRTISIDLANAMQAGGGMRTYLEMKSKELMEMRRETQKVFVDSLSIYGEGYLSGIVMSVVLVVLMIVICSALGIDLKFMTPHQLFNFFVYFALPFLNIIFILLLWMKYSRNAI